MNKLARIVIPALMAVPLPALAVRHQPPSAERPDTLLTASADSALWAEMADSANSANMPNMPNMPNLPDSADSADNGSAARHKSKKRDWDTWRPTPQRALWLALVIPGGGQIYNRKYWKLPIFYGGMVGCIYAMRWNNQMYHDYAQAYLDIMDDDPNTQSYNQFMHLGRQITDENKQRYQELFRKRKDRYRRWRDLSVFVMIGVYAVSVIDAYVDASLSDFDISKDLSLHLEPAVLQSPVVRNPVRGSAVGLTCSLSF